MGLTGYAAYNGVYSTYSATYCVFDKDKETFTGQVVKNTGENGFIACAETHAVYARDVYMWKTYCEQCQLGDWVNFQLHISDKGMPQVCWLEVKGQITAEVAESVASVAIEDTNEKY